MDSPAAQAGAGPQPEADGLAQPSGGPLDDVAVHLVAEADRRRVRAKRGLALIAERLQHDPDLERAAHGVRSPHQGGLLGGGRVARLIGPDPLQRLPQRRRHRPQQRAVGLLEGPLVPAPDPDQHPAAVVGAEGGEDRVAQAHPQDVFAGQCRRFRVGDRAARLGPVQDAQRALGLEADGGEGARGVRLVAFVQQEGDLGAEDLGQLFGEEAGQVGLAGGCVDDADDVGSAGGLDEPAPQLLVLGPLRRGARAVAGELLSDGSLRSQRSLVLFVCSAASGATHSLDPGFYPLLRTSWRCALA